MKNVIQMLAAMGLAAALLQAQNVPGFPKQPSPEGLGQSAPVEAAPPTPAELEAVKKLQGNDPKKIMDAADDFAIRFSKSSLLGGVFTTAGQAAQQLNDSNKARFYYEKAIAADANADFARIMLAADIANNTKDGAQNFAQEMARAERLVSEGMILVDKRQPGPNQSKAEFEAMQRDDMASAHLALGLIGMGRKQYAEAGREFMLSVNTAKNPNVINLLRAGMAFNNAGQVDQADKALDQFLRTPALPDEYKTYASQEKDRGKKIREEIQKQQQGK